MHANESHSQQPLTRDEEPNAAGCSEQSKARATRQKASKSDTKKGKGGRQRVAPYKEGDVWSFRVRRSGLDIYESGFADQEKAHEAMNALVKQLGTGKAPMYGGPGKNTLGKSMQRFGMDHLPGLKGAPQAVRRINRWLTALALPQLVILPVAQADQAPKN